MDQQEQTEMFAEFFNQNFVTNSSVQTPSSLNLSRMECFVLDEYFVFDKLMKIKTNTSVGPDGVHPLVLEMNG